MEALSNGVDRGTEYLKHFHPYIYYTIDNRKKQMFYRDEVGGLKSAAPGGGIA